MSMSDFVAMASGKHDSFLGGMKLHIPTIGVGRGGLVWGEISASGEKVVTWWLLQPIVLLEDPGSR